MLSFLKKFPHRLFKAWSVWGVLFLLLFWTPRFGRQGPVAAIAQSPLSAPSPRVAGVLRLAQELDPVTLDPALSYDTINVPWVRLLYRGMVDYDDKANIVNELAQRREMSRDGKTWTFWIRPGIKYHDSTPLRAEDFRYAIERVTDPQTASDGQAFYNTIVGAKEWTRDCGLPKSRRKLQHISGIEVHGDYQIVFHLTRPDATFLNYLALPFAFPISRAWVNKMGGDSVLAEHPNGCGPYKLQEWSHANHLVLVRNPGFYEKVVPENKRIEVSLGLSTNQQIKLFQNGQLDIISISDAPSPDFQKLTKQDRWKRDVMHRPLMDVRYVSLNTEMWPFTSKKVRQAFNYAINRDRLVALQEGRSVKASGPLPPSMPGYNPRLFRYPYDPVRARRLLKAAGYTNKEPITLYFSKSQTLYEKYAKLIQSDLKAVGVNIQLKSLRYAEVKSLSGRRKGCQMAILGWIQDFPDPSNFLQDCFSAHEISNEFSLNRAFYNNPQVSALLDKAAGETNWKKRLGMYQKIESRIVNDAPWIFLLHSEQYIIHQPWVHDFRWNPGWSAIYEHVKIDGPSLTP